MGAVDEPRRQGPTRSSARHWKPFAPASRWLPYRTRIALWPSIRPSWRADQNPTPPPEPAPSPIQDDAAGDAELSQSAAELSETAAAVATGTRTTPPYAMPKSPNGSDARYDTSDGSGPPSTTPTPATRKNSHRTCSPTPTGNPTQPRGEGTDAPLCAVRGWPRLARRTGRARGPFRCPAAVGRPSTPVTARVWPAYQRRQRMTRPECARGRRRGSGPQGDGVQVAVGIIHHGPTSPVP
jgi:hypothetical protein